ncbi:MAG: hypothetical protein LBR88_04335 [Zoogloeaceae bacterium]|jgi:hypothetical protein|nr:hypothetical protein [Zoogloeaceae bacterium]
MNISHLSSSPGSQLAERQRQGVNGVDGEPLVWAADSLFNGHTESPACQGSTPDAGDSGNLLDRLADSVADLGDTALELAGHAVDAAGHTLSALAEGL